MNYRDRLRQYASLMRLDKPIGTLLLLWPTLWALLLASAGDLDYKILLIFSFGVVLMRAAGCIINDVADRKFDAHVERTKQRVLATGKVSVVEALLLAGLLGGCAFLLVLLCNKLTITLAFIGAGLTIIYPFLKRFTHLPQVGLGMAFAWGIPMAFAAQLDKVDANAWFIYITGMLWPIIYDTMYAMVDREDDKKIGVKSTAILFGDHDKLIIGIMQILFLIMLITVGILFHLNIIYYLSLCIVAILFGYQQMLIINHRRKQCFAAFQNNNWVGMAIFIGIALSYAL